MRVGHGYDAHHFAPDRPLILGGVIIPSDMGLAAHSDGDVLIHALCDALLGAAALGDIGHHFPATSKDYENIDSRILLRKVVTLLHAKFLRVGNVDITVIAEKPKLASFIPEMRKYLAADLLINEEQVNIKATTTEGMGFTGRGEGIAAHAVALLE